MIKENTVVTAYFDNMQESKAFVILERPDGTTVNTLISCGEQSQDYIDLLEQITVEDIRKNTVARQEMERENILAYARSVFEDEVGEIEARMIRKLVATGDSEKEFAFKVKLAAFELEEVKNATTEEKKAIRSAESPLEALYLAAKLVYGKD